MRIFDNPLNTEWKDLQERVNTNDVAIEDTVAHILKSIKEGGEQALREQIEKIEGFCPEVLQVSEEELANAVL